MEWVAERFRRHGGNADVVRQELEREKGIRLSLRAGAEVALGDGGDVPWRFSDAGLRACGRLVIARVRKPRQERTAEREFPTRRHVVFGPYWILCSG